MVHPASIVSIILLFAHTQVVGALSYVPSDYANACVGVLSASYVWGGDKCKGLTKAGLSKCQCDLKEYLETVVSCVDQLVANVSSPNQEFVREGAYKTIAATCVKAKVDTNQLLGYHKNGTDLKPYAGKRPIEKFGKWKANEAFKPSQWECHNALPAYKLSTVRDSRTNRAGAAVLSYWGGVLAIRVVVHWLSKLIVPAKRSGLLNLRVCRALRQYFTMPALITNRHSQPVFIMRWFTLVLPTREQALIIIGFVILHIGLNFGMNPIHSPSYLFHYKKAWLWGKQLGQRSGTVAVFELPLMLLFAGRNNVLQWITGWSHDTFIVFHKWIARCVVFSILLHASAYTAARISQGTYSKMWSTAYWNWGIPAIVFMCVLAFQAMHAIRRLSYEIFLAVHITLAILLLIAVYFHMSLNDQEIRFLYAMWAVWAFDRAMRLARVLISGPFSKAEVVLQESAGVVEYTIEYSKLWKPRPGHYAFVHIVQPTFFWESHPFTLSLGCAPGEEGKLKLFTRVKDGMTKRVMRKALQSSAREFTANVWIDGPYGPSYDVEAFDEALFIAGGIGITAPFSYIQGILSNPKGRATKMTLVWAVSDKTILEWFRHQLEYIRKSGKVTVLIYAPSSSRGQVDPVVEQDDFDGSSAGIEPPSPKPAILIENTGEEAERASEMDNSYTTEKNELKSAMVSSKSGGASSETSSEASSVVLLERLDTKAVVKKSMVEASGALAILCCGPPRMNDDARQTIANNLSATPQYVEYFEEAFSF